MQINSLQELLEHRGQHIYIVMGESVVSGIIDTYMSDKGMSFVTSPTLFININGVTTEFHYFNFTIAFTELKEFLAYAEYHFGK